MIDFGGLNMIRKLFFVIVPLFPSLLLAQDYSGSGSAEAEFLRVFDLKLEPEFHETEIIEKSQGMNGVKVITKNIPARSMSSIVYDSYNGKFSKNLDVKDLVDNYQFSFASEGLLRIEENLDFIMNNYEDSAKVNLRLNETSNTLIFVSPNADLQAEERTILLNTKLSIALISSLYDINASYNNLRRDILSIPDRSIPVDYNKKKMIILNLHTSLESLLVDFNNLKEFIPKLTDELKDLEWRLVLSKINKPLKLLKANKKDVEVVCHSESTQDAYLYSLYEIMKSDDGVNEYIKDFFMQRLSEVTKNSSRNLSKMLVASNYLKSTYIAQPQNFIFK